MNLLPGARCLFVITGAFNTSGGIASVNRSVIHCISERYKIDLISLNEGDCHGINEKEKLLFESYSGFSGCKTRFVFYVWKKILTKKYDLVLCDHINLAAALAPLAILGIVEYNVWLHGMEVYEPKPTLEGRIGIKYSSKCIANSKYTYKQVKSRYPNLNVRLCELSIEPSWEKLNTDLIQKTKDNQIMLKSIDGREGSLNIYILMVGRIEASERYKGHDILIDAFREVVNNHPDVQLVIVGNGSDFNRVNDYALNLPKHIHSNVFMPGYVSSENLNYLYQFCSIFVMPSTGEGFGLVYLEAMSKSKPCIGLRYSAVPEIIEDGITGFLLDYPTSSRQLADKIVYLIDHSDIAQKMGKAGYDRVHTKYLFTHFRRRFWFALESNDKYSCSKSLI